MMDYDVLILGGGINGCAIGYELSKFSLNIALIEKEYEVANDVFPIFYNEKYDKNSISSKAIEKFNIRNKVCNYTEINGKSYTNTKSLSSVQIISAYDLAIGYGEVAFDNGVNFRLHEKVLTIEKISNGYRIVTNKNKFTCKIVIDTLQQENTEADNFSIKCFTIDKGYKFKDNEIMDIKLDTEKKMIIAPNLDGDLYAYLYSKEKICSVEALDILKSLLTDLEDEYIKDNFDIPYKNQEIKIENSKIGEGYFKVVGKNLNVINMISDISKNICKEVTNILKCKMKKDFHDKVREFYRFNYMAQRDINNLIKNNSEYGNIICTCCNISEGEIIECIRRPLGARTIDGIVKRTGAMIGRCGGSYCINKITRILARETNKNLIDVVKHSTDSNVLAARIKEFNGV
jgi:bacterioferritin-associated ferredoxin